MTTTPIPVSERLPSAEAGDLDHLGRCWVFDQGDASSPPTWTLESAFILDDLRAMEAEAQFQRICDHWRLAWLPHWAMQLPQPTTTTP